MREPTDVQTQNSLNGVRVAITRALEQGDAQRASLEAVGAQVYHYPCIEIIPPWEWDSLDNGLKAASNGQYDWLVVTSANTVDALAERLNVLGIEPSALSQLRVAVVGSSTEETLRERLNLDVAFKPDEYTASEMANSLKLTGGERIFLPQSRLAKLTLAEAMRSRGADVTVVDAYRTVLATGGEDLSTLLWEGRVDAITFTSGSTVRHFAKRLSQDRGTLSMLDDVVVACIGPSTSKMARQFGLEVAIMPQEHTINGLTEGLIRHFEQVTQQ